MAADAIIVMFFCGGIGLVLSVVYIVLHIAWFPFYRLLGGVRSFGSYMKKFFKEEF